VNCDFEEEEEDVHNLSTFDGVSIHYKSYKS
jgi:hypothetical protein